MEKDQVFMAEGLIRTVTKPTWNGSNFGMDLQTNDPNSVENCFLNQNWDNSMDQSGPFESALSSMVCSPAASNAGCSSNYPGSIDNNNTMMRELLGKLGNISNSGGDISPQSFIKPNNSSCYNSPLNSPPKLNLSIMDSKIRGSKLLNGDSKEESSVSEQIPGVASNARKRKSIPRGKAKETTPAPVSANAKIAEENDESTAKRSKQQNGSAKEANKEPPKDYIHVRARRGQATDSHSLAERVRREKISERMKFLQDLVPGCNKVTGKAVMLDEIINYVQSLQHQVEFLSMKLATVNPKMNVNMEALMSKDMFRSGGALPHALYSMESSVPAFCLGYQPQQRLPMNNGICNNTEIQFSMNPSNAALQQQTQGLQLPPADGFTDANPQVGSYWNDDLQSIVQMGFGQS